MCDTSSDDDSVNEISTDTPGTANGTNAPIPEKSKKNYMKAYDDFMKWRVSKDYKSFKENVLLEYFLEMAGKLKSTSLNTIYSMLKSTLMLHHEVDISQYSRLLAFLKRNAIGYKVKKAKTFTADEINKFMEEAHDDEHLLTKVALIFGIAGACRRQELYKLQFKDVEVLGPRILVKVKNAKTNTNRVFTITGDYYELCKKYISLRPDHCCCTTFFIQYKSGKCFPQSVGINKFGKLGKTIAKFLGLPKPDLYTGHCFRRTSATILVAADGDILPLKRHIRSKITGEPELDSCMDDSKESSVGNKSIENRNNTSTTVPADCSNNATKSIQEPIQCHNYADDKNNEYVSIDIPNKIITSTDDTMESKDDIWNQIQVLQSFSNASNDVGNTNSPGTSVLEDCHMDDSVDGEDLMGNQNPLEDKTEKVVNINIPSSTSNLQPMVRFDNCSIQNLNIYYNK